MPISPQEESNPLDWQVCEKKKKSEAVEQKNKKSEAVEWKKQR
jgi:hypothetical protein